VHAHRLGWYTKILKVRKELIVPHVAQMVGDAGMYEVLGVGAVGVRFWNNGGDRQLMLAANLGDNSTDSFPEANGKTVWQEGPEQFEVKCDHGRYGGRLRRASDSSRGNPKRGIKESRKCHSSAREALSSRCDRSQERH
jgi:hypothetical protein